MRKAGNVRKLISNRRINYLVARRGMDSDPPYFEVCDDAQLQARLEECFERGGRLGKGELQVIRMSDERPYLYPYTERSLREIWETRREAVSE